MIDTFLDMSGKYEDSTIIKRDKDKLDLLVEMHNTCENFSDEEKEKLYKYFDLSLGMELFTMGGETIERFKEYKCEEPSARISNVPFLVSYDDILGLKVEDCEDYTVEELLFSLYTVDQNMYNVDENYNKIDRLVDNEFEFDITSESIGRVMCKYLDIDPDDFTGEKTKLNFKNPSILDSTDKYKKAIIKNMTDYSNTYVMLIEKLYEHRKTLSKKISKLEGKKKLSTNFLKRALGFKKKKDKYVKADGPTALQVALYRFKQGVMIPDTNSDVDRVLSPKYYKDVVLPIGAKELGDHDTVYLLNSGKVMISSNEVEVDRPVYAHIDPKVLRVNAKSIDKLQLDFNFLHEVLNVTTIKMHGEVLLLRNKAEIVSFREDRSRQQNRTVRSYFNRLKNIYTVTRQATLLANLLGEEDE